MGGGEKKVGVFVMPIVTTRDSRIDDDHGRWRTENVEKHFLDMNRRNLITLTRQPDGIYEAQADGDKAFLTIGEAFMYNGASGDYVDLTALRIAIVGTGNRWDDNGGEDYVVGVR